MNILLVEAYHSFDQAFPYPAYFLSMIHPQSAGHTIAILREIQSDTLILSRIAHWSEFTHVYSQTYDG